MPLAGSQKRQQAEDFSFRGLVITDREAISLLKYKAEKANLGYETGNSWQGVEPRVTASRGVGVALPLDLVRDRFRLTHFEIECMVVCLSPSCIADTVVVRLSK